MWKIISIVAGVLCALSCLCNVVLYVKYDTAALSLRDAEQRAYESSKQLYGLTKSLSAWAQERTRGSAVQTQQRTYLKDLENKKDYKDWSEYEIPVDLRKLLDDSRLRQTKD